jgi:predicted alpha/beta-fold hydrolase
VRRRCAALLAASQPVILDCGEGVRLQGHVAASPRASRPQLAILLHGWEGSSDSMYVLSLGQYLFEHGFDVFRLNLRDHGDSHHLNQGIFHSCLLPEVLGAVLDLARRYPSHRRCMAGFSLGGNFALRIGAAWPAGSGMLSKIVAVSPVLDPQQTLVALEQGNPLYRRYFIDKWRRSLIKKQQAWPQHYDFAHLPQLTNLTVMTEQLVLQHTRYPTLADYLQGYAITGDVLRHLQVPSHIVASRDDPIIPAKDLPRLHSNPSLKVTLTDYGGHCGFRESLFRSSWLDRFVCEHLSAD